MAKKTRNRCSRIRKQTEKRRDGKRGRADRKTARQGRHHAARHRRLEIDMPVIPTGSLSLDLALGVGGLPKGPHHRNLRTGIIGKNHACAPRDRQCAEEGRHRGAHRRRIRV